MRNSKLIMVETGKLVKACLEGTNLESILLEKNELMNIALLGDMQYMLLYPLLKNETDVEFAEKINYLIKKSTFSSYKQAMCAKQISDLFEKEKVKHQLLKGAVIKNIYPSPVMRQMSDIDVVVFDETLNRAAEVLEKSGYINHGLIKHHMIFTSPTGVMVEIHWCLYDQNADYGQYLYFNEFRSAHEKGLLYTYKFGEEDFYIYMIAHMAKHFFENGCGIRNLVDIYVYTKYYYAKLNWSYIEKELKKCGLFDFEKNMKKLSYIWLENKNSSQFYEDVFSYMVECGIYGKAINGVWGQLAKEKYRNKFLLKLRYYFPSLSLMKEKYPWLDKKPFLLPIAWGLRGTFGVMSSQGNEHAELIQKTGISEMEKMLEIYHRMGLNFRKYSKED